jgi:hypothetical protein
MNLSTADLRNYKTEFHEPWWSYRYMFLVDSKVFRFVVKAWTSSWFAERKEKNKNNKNKNNNKKRSKNNKSPNVVWET